MSASSCPPWWHRLLGLFWIVFLVFPIYFFYSRPHPLPVALLAGGLLAALTAVYIWFYGVGPMRSEDWPDGVWGWACVAALTVISVVLGVIDLEHLGTYGFTYALIMAAFAFEWRRALLVILAIIAIDSAQSLLLGAPPPTVALIAGIALVYGAWFVGMSRMLRSNREMARARDDRARLAVSEERLRFARDLHDLLGHSLTQIVLKAELAGRLAETAPQRAAEEIADIERAARVALHEVRDAVSGYRQPSLEQQLVSARAMLAAAGIEAEVHPLAGPLPAAVDATLAWALREGVTNAVRHSGARRVRIGLRRESGRALLEVSDDGRGPGPAGVAPGNGLRGLGERVRARSGTLAVGPSSGGGFTLEVAVPLEAAVEALAAP
ncbi:MAG: sensor histidine kinase [Candidatus Dormibacteraeota bacterium]|nr:sensor histidine kinase [Candidatus Dormibacteraeota bacterium]